MITGRPLLALCFVTVVFGSLLINSSDAFECQPYTGTICRNAFSTPISTDENRTMEIMEATVMQYTESFMGVSFVAPQCYQALVEFACLSTFLPCQNATVAPGVIVPIPTPPCKYTCDLATMLCAPFLAQSGTPLPCEMLPIDVYPDPVPRACFNDSFVGISLQPCPEPNMLVRQGDYGACVPRCGGDYYSSTEEDQLYQAGIIASWISLVCSIIVLITWTLFPYKRSFPSVMVVFVAFGSLMIAVGELMNMKDPEDFHCKNDWTPGIILQYFPLSVAAWWLCISANLHQMIVMKNRTPGNMLKYYHAFAWGLPMILTIISLSTVGFEFDPTGFRVCTLVNDAYSDGLFMSWFMIFGVIGFILIIHVCFELYKAQKQMKSISGPNKNIFRAQIRSIIFLTYYYGVVLCMVSLSYMARYRQDEGEDELTQYFACVFGLTPVTDTSKCSYSYAIAFRDIMFCIVVVFGQGVFLFLTFMTTNDSLGCWKTLILYGSTSYDPNSFEGKMGRKTGSSNSRDRGTNSHENRPARELESISPSTTATANTSSENTTSQGPIEDL